jgi:hypothetical protein
VTPIRFNSRPSRAPTFASSIMKIATKTVTTDNPRTIQASVRMNPPDGLAQLVHAEAIFVARTARKVYNRRESTEFTVAVRR